MTSETFKCVWFKGAVCRDLVASSGEIANCNTLNSPKTQRAFWATVDNIAM